MTVWYGGPDVMRATSTHFSVWFLPLDPQANKPDLPPHNISVTVA